MYDGNKEYQIRKRLRRENFVTNIKGWKMKTCAACSGSGYYDSSDSPNCGACDGTGKTKVRPMETKEKVIEELRRGFHDELSDENCKYFNDNQDWIKAVYTHVLEEKHRNLLRKKGMTMQDILKGRYYDSAGMALARLIQTHVNATLGFKLFTAI